MFHTFSPGENEGGREKIMADTEMQDRSEMEPSGARLFTLSEVAKKTGISMPTLQRYKKLFQERIPAEGKGRRQRYPEGALAVFREIRQENAGKRGRPRKSVAEAVKSPVRRAAKKATPRRGSTPVRAQAAPARRTAAGKKGPRGAVTVERGRGKSSSLLTLTQIGAMTGISYPTLVRYVRLYLDRLPHEGEGRARRFYQKAVDVFRELRREGGRGKRQPAKAAKAAGVRSAERQPRAITGSADSGLGQRVKSLEKSQQVLEKRLATLVQSLRRFAGN
jgi:predicted DNA-binding transcriptional regulator AlpA